MLPILVHIDITLVAGMVSFGVRAGQDFDTSVRSGLYLVDFVWNARIAQQAHQESKKASTGQESSTWHVNPACAHVRQTEHAFDWDKKRATDQNE